MSCSVCKGEKYLYNSQTKYSYKGDFMPGVTINVENGKLYIDAIADTYEPNYIEIETDIFYCPVCGEKFAK